MVLSSIYDTSPLRLGKPPPCVVTGSETLRPTKIYVFCVFVDSCLHRIWSVSPLVTLFLRWRFPPYHGVVVYEACRLGGRGLYNVWHQQTGSPTPLCLIRPEPKKPTVIRYSRDRGPLCQRDDPTPDQRGPLSRSTTDDNRYWWDDVVPTEIQESPTPRPTTTKKWPEP